MVLAQRQAYKPTEQNKNIEIHPCIYSQEIFTNGTKSIHWEKSSFFNSGARKMKFACREMKLNPSCHYKNQIKVLLNLRPETMKILEENLGEMLQDIALDKGLPQTQGTKNKKTNGVSSN
jgi:hypothetical protein